MILARSAVSEVDLDRLRYSYLRNALGSIPDGTRLSDTDFEYLAAETRTNPACVREVIDEMHGKTG